MKSHAAIKQRPLFAIGLATTTCLLFQWIDLHGGVLLTAAVHGFLRGTVLCVLAIVLWTLLTRLDLFPPWFKPLRLAAAIFLTIVMVCYAALLFLRHALSEQSHSARNETAEFVVIERGNFGSTWTDIVERRRIALVFVKERPLVQYKQGKVVGLDATAPKVLRVRFAITGGGERVEELRLD